jgi:hypothetical protein
MERCLIHNTNTSHSLFQFPIWQSMRMKMHCFVCTSSFPSIDRLEHTAVHARSRAVCEFFGGRDTILSPFPALLSLF